MTIIKLDQKRPPDPNLKDGKGRTRLHELCSDFNVTIGEVRQALNAGCDVSAVDNWGETPLHLLVESWMSSATAVELIRILVEAGADVNAGNGRGRTPIYGALIRGDADHIHALLQAGAHVNARDKYGDTPLHEAVNRRDTDMVALLLEHGADFNAKNGNGKTPLHLATEQQNFACIRVLRECGAEVGDVAATSSVVVDDMAVSLMERGVKVEDAMSSGDSVVELTEKKRRSNPDARDSKGRTWLHELCRSYNVTVNEMRQALKDGADVNAVDNWGDTPLHHLASGRTNDIKGELIRVLIEAGADVDAGNYRKMTPLFNAIHGENVDYVRALLQAGANINVRNKSGDTPLHEATWKRDTDLLTLLLEHGAAVNARNKWFETPLRIAQSQNNFACTGILREHGAYASVAGQLAMALQHMIGKITASVSSQSH